MELFVDAFNATGLILMMSIHTMVINCLLHNPDAFAHQPVKSLTTKPFKADLS